MAEKMKPSGIDWIGDVPENWYMIKLKYFSYLKGRIGWQGLTADEFIDEGPYLITGTDFENGRIQFDRSYHISDERYNEAPEIQLKEGDLLVTKDGTVGKMAYVDMLPDKASLNSHLLLIRPLENKFDNRFLFWLMSSSVFSGYTEYAQDGTVMASLSQEKIGNFIAYFPEIAEQQAIADFLDKECAQIDSIAADLEKQIALLQQYKKSLITETVTKGLDKSVPMKDSGVEWIGKIPAHWKAKRLKYVMNNFDAQRKAIEAQNRSQDGEILYDYYGASGAIDKIDDYIFDETSILIGEDGANLVLRNLPLIYIATGKYWVNNHAHILRPKSESDLYYMAHQMEIIDYSQFITGSAQPKLSQENLNNVFLVVPPLNEQQCIASYLEEKISCIDIIFSRCVFFKNGLPGSFQNQIHLVHSHISDPVNKDFHINHQPQKIWMSRQFTKQAVVDLSAAQKFHHSVTQMQSLKLRVWVIFIFGQSHQIISGHSVKLCQCCNRKWTDVFVVIALIFPQCRLRQAGLLCQLFQRQVLIHNPQVFEPFRD